MRIITILRNRFFLLFSLCVITALCVGVMWAVNFSLGFSDQYPVEGNYGQKYAHIFMLFLVANLLLAIVTSLFASASSPLRKLRWYFIACGAIIFLYAVANIIPRDFQATYYLGNEAYVIPGEYSPSRGQLSPPGSDFFVRVSYPDFEPRFKSKNYNYQGLYLSIYQRDSLNRKIDELIVADIASRNSLSEEIIEIGSAETANPSRGVFYALDDQGEIRIDGFCENQNIPGTPRLNCEFTIRNGDYYYRGSYHGNSFPPKTVLPDIEEKAVSLFASFKK